MPTTSSPRAVQPALVNVCALFLVLITAWSSSSPAAMLYIGDAASQGPALTTGGGTRADTVTTLTYVSTDASSVYVAPVAQTLTLKEVNFFGEKTGTLTPFVARYNGGGYASGANYTVLAMGDPISVSTTNALVNASFTVGGTSPTVSLAAGETLAAGWQQNGNIVYISNLGTSGTPEYIANGNSLPPSTGSTLTMNSNWAFDRTMQFNIGFEGGTPPPTTLKIMPLGDSITYGVGGTNAGYRGPLYDLLTAEGMNFQFVGSATGNPGPLPASQQHHEGHSGYVITSGTSGRSGLTDNITAWLGTTNPDIILLMIGTNDVNLNYQLATAPDRLSNLISMISNKATGLEPDATLVVAQIVPIVNDAQDVLVYAYNQGVAAVVAAHKALGENVMLVDMHSPLTDADMNDNLHPNNSGYDKMAQVWFDAILAATTESEVPEPLTLALVGAGLTGLGGYARRRRAV